MQKLASVQAALWACRRAFGLVRHRARPAPPKPPVPLRAIAVSCGIALVVSGLSTVSAAASDKPKSAKPSVKQSRSPAEETQAERDRRLYREYAGRPNAGACLGYTRKP